MSEAAHTPLFYGRCILAPQPGSHIASDFSETDLPPGYTLLRHAKDTADSTRRTRGTEQEDETNLEITNPVSIPPDSGGNLHLPPPFDQIPILPRHAQYAGEIIGVLIGPGWRQVDRELRNIPLETPAQPDTAKSGTKWGTEHEETLAPQTAAEDETADDQDSYQETQIVEGGYRTEVQLHAMDVPLWAEVRPYGKDSEKRATRRSGMWSVRLPAQWPQLVRIAVARALRITPRRVELHIVPVQAPRDGALHIPAHLAALAALGAIQTGTAVRVALRGVENYITGGRSPSEIRITSRIDNNGTIMENRWQIVFDGGAYPSLTAETRIRAIQAAERLYAVDTTRTTVTVAPSPSIPFTAFEGIGAMPVTFAREVHYNRIATLLEEDPLTWRQRSMQHDWPVLQELAQRLAEEADFTRRYAANELVRKRRLQLPQNSSILRGIGCALGEQKSTFQATSEIGFVTVRLEAEGSARLYCSVPTPNPRLRYSWRTLVAQSLQLEIEQVVIETGVQDDQSESGPRLFSRGVTLVPRAINSCCEAIQKQRFRDPLPLTVRRALRLPRRAASSVPADSSLAVASVEISIVPATMSVDVRQVTMVVYAGRILDRNAAEAELRRGIYQALSWLLFEGFPDAEHIADPLLRRRYTPHTRTLTPKIRIVFLNPTRRDGPVGLGELPFLTVPAACTSALSQATGLFLDVAPTRMADTLRLLRDD